MPSALLGRATLCCAYLWSRVLVLDGECFVVLFASWDRTFERSPMPVSIAAVHLEPYSPSHVFVPPPTLPPLPLFSFSSNVEPYNTTKSDPSDLVYGDDILLRLRGLGVPMLASHQQGCRGGGGHRGGQGGRHRGGEGLGRAERRRGFARLGKDGDHGGFRTTGAACFENAAASDVGCRLPDLPGGRLVVLGGRCEPRCTCMRGGISSKDSGLSASVSLGASSTLKRTRA